MNPEGTNFLMEHREQFAGDRPTLRAILECLGFPDSTLEFYPESAQRF